MYQSFFRLSLVLFIAFSAGLISCSDSRSGKPRILVFTKTAGYRHASIESGVQAILALGQKNNFDVDTTSNAEWFIEDTLSRYSTVLFLNTTGNVLDHYQEAELERYIQAGGGYVGVHAAADCEYDWGWYGRMVGAYFLTHPGIRDTFPNVQPGTMHVVDKDHISTKGLPEEWKRTDEFYSFKKIDTTLNVLVKVDENTFKGGYNGDNHPMSWYHEYDGGRAWYTNFGHTNESFSEPLFLQHLLGGIQYAIGDNKKLNYKKARTLRVPEENRFTKTRLINAQLFEPTEMTVLPNLDILIAQRRGELLLYKNGDSVLREAGFLNVYWKANTPKVNAEEGLLGIQKDPNFAKNNFVFIYYSPADKSVNRLSRFVFRNDKVDMASEKVILEVNSDREICCHTGGSIAFDKDGLLFLSTGDNSTPFDEPKEPHRNGGYAPIDDRPGHEQYDARRTSGNANDLRGKILRIRVKEDGTYEIPEGNLYPKNMEGTRPEIYVQGNRNPYRISVDQKNGYLYWGEVGPDASKNNFDVRGPRGYDEVNQARKAGFFGWPLFVGDNYAYREYDFQTGKQGDVFDPKKPLNTSRNNTGIRELPPAVPAFIWYPYDASPDFPQVGAGGRNAMAGPVYYTDMFPKETRLPDYYNGKVLIYDWMRGWIKAVTLKPNGDFDKMEPFMENTKLYNCIDMEVGPDGKLYLLEYGSGWFAKNPDAGLARVDYNAGNRPPVIHSIAVDKTSGTLPLNVVFSVDAGDLERDKMSYEWHFPDGSVKQTTTPKLEHSFTTAGDYAVYVTVKDDKGATSKSAPVAVYAGNEAPVVTIKIEGNSMFYFPGKPVTYSVTVADKETPNLTPEPGSVFVSAEFVEGLDKAGATLGHQKVSEVRLGKNIMESLDCKGCHKESEKSIGPAYTEVAARYKNNPDAMSYLSGKIIKGGGGVWGENVMPAHATLPERDARQIALWIMSLAQDKEAVKSLPAQGSVTPPPAKGPVPQGQFVISASYTDKGGNGIKPLTGEAAVALQSSSLDLGGARQLQAYTSMNYDGRSLLMVPKQPGSFVIADIDLTEVTGIDFMLGFDKRPIAGYRFEIRLDSQGGTKIGEVSWLPTTKSISGPGGFNMAIISAEVSAVADGKRHSLYIVSAPLGEETGTAALSAVQLK